MHCIPKDPWLLMYTANEERTALRLIPAAREINDSMPLHVVALLQDALKTAGSDIAGSRVLVMGYAYLADSDDTRNSPSALLVDSLQELGAEVIIHDPYIDEFQSDIWSVAVDIDAVVVMVRHSQYLDLDLVKLKATMKVPVLVDGRNVFDPEQVQALEMEYRAVGRGKPAR
jgi:nucleotide sugar dehydrogenase